MGHPTARSQIFQTLNSNNLAKHDFFRKTILTCVSGAQMGSIHKKIEVENLMTLPLGFIFSLLPNLRMTFWKTLLM